VTVERVEPDQRKISLAPGDKGADGDWTRFTRSGDAGASFSSLGDKLRKALDKKKS
jgi:hypothetical protein